VLQSWIGWGVRLWALALLVVGGALSVGSRLPGAVLAYNDFANTDGRLRAIFLLDANRPGLGSREWTRHVPQPFYYHQPNLSPDGASLVFFSRVGGRSTLYTLALGVPPLSETTDGERAQPLTTGGDIDTMTINPVWSPDGTRIAFAASRVSGLDIFVMNLRLGAVSTIVASPAHESHPAWSPDGRWLAYEAWLPDSAEIMIVPSTGGTPRRLTHNRAVDQHPAWSPDGRWLAYVSSLDGGMAIFMLDIATGAARRLSETAFFSSEPTWLADGRQVAYLSLVGTRQFISVVDVLSGETRRLVPTRTDHLWSLWG
jgi:Tol biopolymer transport system component